MDSDSDLEDHFTKMKEDLATDGDEAFQTFDGNCGWFDLACKVQEFLINSYISLLRLAFDVGDMEALLGADNVSEVRGAWLAVGIVLLLAAGTFQLIIGAIQLSSRGVARAAVMTMIGMPLVFISLDAARLLESGAGVLANNILTFGFSQADGDPSGAGAAIAQIGLSMPSNNIAIIVLGVISAALLAVAFAFRALVLLLLIVFAPVMIVGIGYEKTREYAGLWVKLVTAMVLAKPLIATVIAIGGPIVITSFNSGGSNLGVALVGMIGFGVAAFMPIVAFQLVSFMGGQIAGSIDMAASSAKGALQRVGNEASKAGSVAGGGGSRGSAATRPVPTSSGDSGGTSGVSAAKRAVSESASSGNVNGDATNAGASGAVDSRQDLAGGAAQGSANHGGFSPSQHSSGYENHPSKGNESTRSNPARSTQGSALEAKPHYSADSGGGTGPARSTDETRTRPVRSTSSTVEKP